MRRTVLCVLFLVVLSALPLQAQTIELVDAEGSLLSRLQTVQNEQHTFVDLYELFRSLEFSVEWDPFLDRFEASRKDISFRFVPGMERVRVDDRLYPVPGPTLHEGRLFLAVQPVTRLLRRHSGKSVIWNPARAQMQLTPAEAEAAEEDPVGRFIDETPRTEGNEMLVVVDPGHGGRDPGAIGKNGSREKQVVLDLARELKGILQESYPNIRVRLTRGGDRFIPLKSRTRIANEIGADVFVSLHANSAQHSSRARGFEVYTLSGQATDPSAQELADVENSALRYEGYQQEELEDISWILWQLRSTVHTRESQKFAGLILDRLQGQVPTNNRGAKKAPFWVLKDAQMPAVLFESGFLSNPSEERKLRDREYLRKLARGLAGALEAYRENRL